MSRLPEETIQRIRPQNPTARAKATARIEQLTMPHWALGRVLDLAVDLAGITGQVPPPVERKVVVVIAADHGVAAEGVSKYPQAVTVQMVHNFATGGAGINVLARQAGARVVVVDMGVAGDLAQLNGQILSRPVARGTQNMARGPAMTRDQANRALEVGIELACELASSCDLFATGDMGIANTTAGTAIAAVLTGYPVVALAGRGTGLDDQQLGHKVQVIARALEVNRPDRQDPLGVLAKVGGFEIGGLAGVMLGAAALGKPVLVDGFISTAAALLAHSLAPLVTDHLIAAHRGAEPGHRLMLEYLGKAPLLDLGLRLGEGTGAALAMSLVDAAVGILREMSTFENANVSRSDK
jgi:nicotinate-nucleotide--dimethylbenzimidazole phosphoribosyltransferase